MPTTPITAAVYPPAAVARAVAAISVSLPGAPATARCRLAAVLDACDAHEWPDTTQTALLRGATQWFAMACWLGETIPTLQLLDPALLLARLESSRDRGEAEIEVS